MMTALSLMAVLAAAPVSVALPGLNGVNLAPGEIELHTETLTQRLSAVGLQVMTSRDIGAVLGLERQKAMVSCTESSCLAELVGALGADGLITGDVGRLDGAYLVNVKVLAATHGKSLALFSGQAKSAQELSGVFRTAARSIATQLASSLKRPDLMPAADVSPATSVRTWSLLPFGVGVAALGAGIGCQVAADEAFAELEDLEGTGLVDDARALKESGATLDAVGVALLVTGGVAVATGAVMFFVGAPADAPVPTAMVLPNGGGWVGLSGTFP